MRRVIPPWILVCPQIIISERRTQCLTFEREPVVVHTRFWIAAIAAIGGRRGLSLQAAGHAGAAVAPPAPTPTQTTPPPPPAVSPGDPDRAGARRAERGRPVSPDDARPVERRASLKECLFRLRPVLATRGCADRARSRLAGWLKHWPGTDILVEGHADERGTAEYNLALGKSRARVVEEYLVSLGIPQDRIKIDSLGKDAPFCTQDNEGCWSKNRRGHFIITAK